jgi:tetratricopeptide (TPR) repeat protein
MPKRVRGRFLTDKGWNKLGKAIDLQFPDGRPPLTAISERTDPHLNPQAGRFVSTDVISNILNRRAKADRPLIEALFKAFGLTVETDDVTPDAPYTSSPSADRSFVGREDDLKELHNLVQAGHKAIQIVAAGGIGKTRLVQEYLKQFDSDKVLRFNIAKETNSVASPIGTIEEWLKKLGVEPGREFNISIHRLIEALQKENSKIYIWIDNLEPTLENGIFIQPYRSEYIELLRVLTDLQVNSITLITSREPLHESAISVATYKLKGLDLKAWQQYFQGQNVETHSSCLEEMRNAYDGNAEAMKILCGAIRTDYEGNLDTCWKTMQQDLLQHPTLEHLVMTQFDRLQQTNLNAYNLLCRLGCYRYQDVTLVPEAGVLCLLWDVQNKPWRVLNELKDRCLVDVSQQQYRLHPVIREAAIDRLRKNKEDWETANRKAAEFWTKSVETVVTERDAIRALEAYYHYVEIEDFDSAAQIINYSRVSEFSNELLGISFYILGLLNQIIQLIESIIEKVSSGYDLSRMYNILGDSYWMNGRIHKAIECHNKSQKIAYNTLMKSDEKDREKSSDLKNLYLISFYNIGLCELDLGDRKKSLEIFELLPEMYQDPDCRSEYRIGYCFVLSYLYSELDSLKHNKKISNYLEKTFSNINYVDIIASWSVGYRYLFLGLTYKNIGEENKAFQMFDEAINFAKQSNYTQVRAKALTGLGELYRIQGDFDKAIPHHQESIELLDKICAKCDLAEAYFQCALTYQAMGETAESQKNLDAALQLFGEIEAPKQIERVQQAMKTVID